MAFDKVAVTGGGGLLGSKVLDALRGRADVTVIDRKAPQTNERFVEADATSYSAMRDAMKGADAVVHLAAVPNPRSAPADVTFQTNVMAAWSVLQAAEEAGVRRVVVASSDSIFGFTYNPPDWPPQFLPIDESHPTRPTEFYSLSKGVTEAICQSYAARRKMEIVVIRPTYIVFPRDYATLEARGADPQNYHNWTYVSPEDVAQGFRLGLETRALKNPIETFVISADDGLNTRPTLDLVRERYGHNMPKIRKPEIYEQRPTASMLDTTRAKEILGFVPTSDWRKMLA